MTVSLGEGVAVVTTVVHVFDITTHSTHQYDENKISLLLFQLYFKAKTAPSELFVFD